MDKQDFRILENNDNQLKIDKDLIEIQKTIISYGDIILKEVKEIKDLLIKKQNRDISEKMDSPILRHLKNLKIPDNYGGNHLDK